VAVSVINDALGEIIKTNKYGRLEVKDVVTDVEALQKVCKRRDAEVLSAIQAIYKGPFLDDYERRVGSVDSFIKTWIENQRNKLNTMIWKVWLELARTQKSEGYKILEQGYTTAHKLLPDDDEMLRELYVLLKRAKSDLAEVVRQEAKERRVKLPAIKEEIPEVKSLPLSEPVPTEISPAALSTESSADSPATTSVFLEPSQLEKVATPEETKEAVPKTLLQEEGEQNLPGPSPTVEKEEPPKSGVKKVTPTLSASSAMPRLSNLFSSRFLKVGGIALAIVGVLALVAWFFLTRFPKDSSLELTATVSGLTFTLAEPETILTGIAVQTLAAQGLASVRLPITAAINGELQGGEFVKAADEKGLYLALTATDTPMTLFPNDLRLPANTQITLRLAEEDPRQYALEIHPAVAFEVALQGEVKVELSNGFGSETRDYGQSKVMTLTAQDTLELFFTPLDARVIFSAELNINGLGLILDKPSQSGHGSVNKDGYSAVLGGTLQTQGKEQVLNVGDRLSLEAVTGRLLGLTLEPESINFRLKGTVQKIRLE
jgi:hypothetical protein